MLTAGDEFGRTQKGNNNAYAQDNDLTWLDWAGRDIELERYVVALGCDAEEGTGPDGRRLSDRGSVPGVGRRTSHG